jgi:hypothetical protein
MGSSHFNVVVVLFWCATMTWLLVAKVLPPMRVGEPPGYLAIVQESEQDKPVCWAISLRERTIGWAANRLVRRKEGMAELSSRVYLAELPLEELTAGIGALLRPFLDELADWDLDKKTRLTIDPLGGLVGFDSQIRLGKIDDAIKIRGQIEGGILKLTVRTGDSPIRLDVDLPPRALLGDDLSPQTRLPGLRVGQSWTVPMYSPFQPPNKPLEILQATVERQDSLRWGGHTQACKVIVYRSDSGSSTAARDARARAWVADDGRVLRQEVAILRTHLHFVRLSDAQSDRVSSELGDDWSASLPEHRARRILSDLAESSP